MDQDHEKAMLDGLADLEDVCGDLFGLPSPAELAGREKAFAKRTLRADPFEGAVGDVVPFPNRGFPDSA
jgi:hypothetical protein